MILENHLKQLTVKQRYILDKISNSKKLILKCLLLLILCLVCFVVIGMCYFETNEINFLVLAVSIILIPTPFLTSKLLNEVKYHNILIEDVNFFKNEANNVFSGEITLSNEQKINGIFVKTINGNYREIESNTEFKSEFITSVTGEN